MTEAPVTYTSDFMPSEHVFDALWNDLPWEQRPDAPRRECWFNPYGEAYTYGSGEHARTYESHLFEKDHSLLIHALLTRMNHMFSTSFDCCFVNGYAHGRQHLGWHADDSPEMDMEHPIAVISFGAPREIWFREKPNDGWSAMPSEGFKPGELQMISSGSAPQRQMLENGSLLMMHAGMQRGWQHRIPKSPLGENCGPRISLTYRRLIR